MGLEDTIFYRWLSCSWKVVPRRWWWRISALPLGLWHIRHCKDLSCPLCVLASTWSSKCLGPAYLKCTFCTPWSIPEVLLWVPGLSEVWWASTRSQVFLVAVLALWNSFPLKIRQASVLTRAHKAMAGIWCFPNPSPPREQDILFHSCNLCLIWVEGHSGQSCLWRNACWDVVLYPIPRSCEDCSNGAAERYILLRKGRRFADQNMTIQEGLLY